MPNIPERILVTGAGGFIGKHLLQRLRRETVDVSVITRRPLGSGAREFVGDICDSNYVTNVVTETKPLCVIHLAGSRARVATVEACRTALTVDVMGTLNLLSSAITAAPFCTIILLGSIEEYGCGRAPFTEEMREAPITAYSLGKVVSTHISQMFWRAHKLRTVVLRPSVVYGPGAPGDMLVMQLMEAARTGRPLPMTPGDQLRDFVYVEDVIEATLLASMSRKFGETTINVASGKSIRIRELVEMAEAVTGCAQIARLGAIQYRSSEMMDYSVDVKAAETLLGWRATTSLADGLLRTWKSLMP